MNTISPENSVMPWEISGPQKMKGGGHRFIIKDKVNINEITWF